MRRISRVVRRKIAGKYTSAENKLELFDPYEFQTEELNSDVRTMNTFFRRLLIRKTNVTAENVVDLKGSEKLWRCAQKLHSLVVIKPDEKFENPITGQNDMHLSTVISVIQFAEILSVQNKFSNHVYISEAGLIDEFFVTKLFRDEFGEHAFRFEELSTRNLFPPIKEY